MAAPSPRRAGSGKMPVAVNPAPMAWERVAVLLLLGSRHPSWGTDHCQEGRITDAAPRPVCGAHEGIPRPRPWGDHADPRPRQEWCEAMGATRKRLSPSQRCVEQAGTSWGWGELFGGQPGTRNPGDLQTHARSPGSQADRGKHPQPPPSSPVGQRRDVFPGAVLLTLPRLPAPSPRGGQVFALLPGNGAGAKLAKI